MSLPAYLQILQSLRTRLANGDWRVGDQIPTDEDLMQQFDVSRFTVRAALDAMPRRFRTTNPCAGRPP
jgi:GntR family transcriptional regulator